MKMFATGLFLAFAAFGTAYLALDAISEHQRIFQECGGVYCPQDETR